jgi:hypothetical protein
MGKQGNNISATKITLGKHQKFLNWVGNIFASMGGQTRKHLRKHHESHANVSATMFPSLPRA